MARLRTQLQRALSAQVRRAGAQATPLLGQALLDLICEENALGALALLSSHPNAARAGSKKAGFGPLHWACCCRGESGAELVAALLLCGAHPDGNGASDTSSIERPLRWAIQHGNPGSLEALLSKGAIPRIEDLHDACRFGQGECAIALARHGLDPFDASLGRSPIEALGAYLAQSKLSASPTDPRGAARAAWDFFLAQRERAALDGALGCRAPEMDTKGRKAL